MRLGERSDWRPQRMTERQLLAFVADVIEQRVLIDRHVIPFEDIGCVFPALGFLQDVSLDARKEIGACYEYRDLAVGKTRHGNPTFEGVKFVHAEDWLRARDIIAAEVVRRQGAGA